MSDLGTRKYIYLGLCPVPCAHKYEMLGAIYNWLFPPRTGDVREGCLYLPRAPHGAKVAIVGAGVGGCCAASFLRELGGEALEIHVYSDGPVGGRTATVEIGGHLYETGGSMIHKGNKYLVDMAKKYGLQTQQSKNSPTTPLGVFDGTKLVFHTGTCSVWNTVKLFLRYGFSPLHMMLCVKATLKRFSSIYQLQSEGTSFATMPDMLRAMGGDGVMYQNTQVSAGDFCTLQGWSTKMVNELVMGGLRNNYGQGESVNAFTMLVSMAGGEDGSLWKVIGGNKQIPINALQNSGAILHNARVIQITRQAYDGSVKYILDYKEEESTLTLTQEVDVVIIAFPLNSPNPHGVIVPPVQFEGFPTPVYTPPTRTPYHNTVATFVRGEINPLLFGCKGLRNSFPLFVLTTENYSGRVDFNSVQVQVPCDVADKDVPQFLKPLSQDPVRLWKVFTSNHSLTEEQKKVMFKSRDPSVDVAVNWMAYPQYDPPEEFPPFILDDGMFYVNAVEKAASAMEMSAIGAKNAALLAMEYLVKKSH